MVADNQLPLWWYAAIIPEPYAQMVSELINDSSYSVQHTSSDLREVKQLFCSTESHIKALCTRLSEHWLWTVHMNDQPWDEINRQQVSEHHLPPLRYSVEVAITLDPQYQECVNEVLTPHHCLLTPAELRLITTFNADLGRRITDELDGQRPTTHR